MEQSGKGKGSSVRSDVNDLRSKLTEFDSQITSTFLQIQRIDERFSEFTESDTLIKSVIEKVVESVKDKFDA